MGQGASSHNPKRIGVTRRKCGRKNYLCEQTGPTGADFYRVVEQIKDVLGAKPMVMTIPIGIEDDFKGIVDILTQEAWIWDDSGDPEKYEIVEIPDDLKEKAAQYREDLIELAVEEDDD